MVHDPQEANPKQKESMIQNPTVHTSKNATCKGFKEEIKFNSRIYSSFNLVI
jgi:hypothetical protein